MVQANNIAVIVLNYNTPALTMKNVDILYSKNEGVHVIIVDNLSTDDSFDILSEHYKLNSEIDVVSSGENGGYSKGNNFGIKYALGNYPQIEYVAIMNPDVLCAEDNVLISLAGMLKEDRKLAVLAPLMIQDDHIVPVKVGWKCENSFRIWQKRCYWANSLLKNRCSYDKFEINEDKVLYCEVVQGSFFIIKRAVFEQVGFFVLFVFLYYEENILGKKIKALGYKEGTSLSCTYIHEHHFEPLSLSKEKRLKRREYASAEYYCKECLKSNNFLVFVLKLQAFINLNIELPLVCMLKCINKR